MTLLVALSVLVLPGGVIEAVQAVQAWAASLPFCHAQPVAPCPPDMALVAAAAVCVDVLPYPNLPPIEPLLSVSATPEEYLDLGYDTWDCESLCGADRKRLCTAREWRAACEGTPEDECGTGAQWVAPDWEQVARRDPRELRRLDQHARLAERPYCVSRAGVRMMTTVEEWVRLGDGYAFSRSFWARPGGCHSFVASHAPNWHDYATACRCCMDPRR